MGDRIEQNHSGSGDNVARDKHVHVYQSAPPPKPTGDGPPTNLQDRGVARDRFFGRDDVLAELHQLLQTGDHRVAIASVDGMGGVGKSELAVQYARQHLHETYRGGVVWLAGERAGVELLNFARSRFFPTVDLAEFGDLPEQLDHCLAHWPAQEVPPESVLLIFDDVTDYRTQVEAILPSDSRFRVLITTRAKFQGVERLELQVLTPEAALQLLESIVGRERIAAEPKTAAALCEWLGYLPLGIELVGYYLKRKADLSLATMQERLAAKRLQAPAIAPKDRDFPEGMTARRGVAAAFELSWQALDSEAQRLAVLLGCFGPAPVLWEWVQGCLPNDDEEELEEARDQLVKLSLVKAEDGQSALHPLIREFFAAKRADWPEGGALQQAFLGQMVSVAQTVPYPVTLADLARTRPAWQHLETAAAASGEINDEDCIWAFTALARLAEGQGLWDEAEQHYSDCLSTTERRFGPDHPTTATSLNDLAGLYYSQGRYEAAEPLFRRSLEIREQVLGVDHPDTAQSLNSLANLYQSQGRYEAAEPLYRRSLEIREQVLGVDHPDTAISLNSLAHLYKSQGQYKAAELLYRGSLEIHKQVLGTDHPDTATILNNLAGLYQSQGRYEAAEHLYRLSLEIREQVLGADHLDTATSLNNLANLCLYQGWYEEAEPLLRRSLEIRERVLGADHPSTATILNNLAGLYESQGRYEAAEPLYRLSLEIKERVLGADHPDTAISLNNLAHLYQSQGRYEAAEPLYRRCLEIFLEKLGQDHPNTQTVQENFRIFVQTVIEADRAAELSDHPLTQSILQQLTTPPKTP
ncbi:tetratricopeptide repeat protein [Limnothrix sp. FACHB-708]|nr:tetratricopeptide repeat protein [Limnothrix sp. FACHB-708]MBD2592466.1 tetratricopeptide repeat protein [Limnothrix sp. FACHB-406]